MREVTQWFDGEDEPVNSGVYQRDYTYSDNEWDRNVGVAFCYWDGKLWMIFSDTIREAAAERAKSNHQKLPWRGLAKEPK